MHDFKPRSSHTSKVARGRFAFTRAALACVALLFIVVSAHAQSKRAAPQTSGDFARARATLVGHTGDIICVAFSPDGKILATGAEDGTVRLWDAQTGAARATLSLTKKLDFVSVWWSPDGVSLATDWREGFDTRESHVQVWDARDGSLRATLTGHRWGVNTVEWSADGKRIVTASEDGTARVWDAQSGASLAEIVYEKLSTDKYTDSLLKATFTRARLPEFIYVQARFTDGGQRVVVFSYSKPPRLYTDAGDLIAPLILAPLAPQPPRRVQSPPAQSPPPSVVAPKDSYVFYRQPVVSPDGRLVLTSDSDGVRVWDAHTGERKFTLVGAGGDYYFSPDSRQILTMWRNDPLKWVGDSSSLKLWDAATGELIRSFDNLPTPYQIFWSPDGSKLVVTGYAKTKTRVLDARDGRVLARLPWEGCTPDSWFGDGGCDPFIFNADGRITLKLKGELKIFATTDGSLLATLRDTDRRAAFSPTDPRLLAARSKDKKAIYLYELKLN